ncbi:MAG: hypothetical protein GC205_08760 [Bacteroidetes bacterium]|nr:hypothetical protein [Bacteroidota bacterium]
MRAKGPRSRSNLARCARLLSPEIAPTNPALKTADIHTPQQVVIRYELASLRERIMAFLLDQATIWFGLFLLFILFAIVGGFDSRPMQLLMMVLVIAIFWTYSLVLEIMLDGQTLGKRLMGLKVVKLSGVEPRPGDFVMRWMFRLLDIWGSLGALGSLMIGTTPNAQRIGDLLADTIVIRIRPVQHVALPTLLRMHEATVESAVYSRAGRFTEEEMLLAMEVLDRVQRLPNPANLALLDQLSTKLGQELALPAVPRDQDRFVRQVIRDYVLLTR